MKRFQPFLFLVLFTWSSLSVFSEGKISGVVSSGNEKLAFVFVVLEGTDHYTSTDLNGEFVFNSVKSGRYKLVAKYLGYKPAIKEVVVEAGKNLVFNIQLERDILGLEGYTVTGNRNSEERKSSSVIVNVMNKQHLENISANSFSDGIKYSPGIRTETNCQNCGFSQVRINGLPGSYSQILVDGRATFSALNSIYGLDQIPVEMVEKIEVVKGGGSALYGSSAIAGTINIITAEPIKNSLSVKAESGLINGQSLDNVLGVSGSYVSSNFNKGITFFGAYRNRESYDHNADGFSELPKTKNLGGGFRGFIKTGKFGKLNVEFHALDEYRRGGNLLALEPHEADIAEELKSNVIGGGLSYDLFTKSRQSKFNIYSSIQSTQMDNYYGAGKDVNGYGETSDLSTVTGVQYNNSHIGLWKSKSNLVAGAEYKTDLMKDEKPGYNLYVNQDLRTAGFYAQYESYFAARFKVSLGGRYDWFNLGNEGNFSPRINMMYSLNDAVRIRGGYARGFRIPQIFSEDVHVELVGGEIQAIQLAKNLSPELSDSYTISLDWDKSIKKGVMEIVLEGFYTQIHNPFILEAVDGGNNLMILERRNGTGAEVLGGNVEFKITDQKKYAFQSSFT
ncbi:MAG: TonB-dependent receptor, partial [Salibacteraceae bacterium]